MLRAVLLVAGITTTAHATPPEPRGPHPRLLLDDAQRAAWRAQAKESRSAVASSITLCRDARDTDRFERALYQGSEWARALQACLVAWAATDRDEHAATAITYFTALLDDLERLGDGLGGDRAGTRDRGYAIRNLGPYTALAYDWLHDRLSPALRQRARARWAAWLDWYREHGYRPRDPGTNYHAGYLAAATLIAIAQGGEATEQRGGELWARVADELWGQDMAEALAPGGILDGGDWPEGWQYGPLAVAHYALAARAARAAGIAVPGVETWLASVLRRHVYALSPADRVYVGHDTEDETPQIAPSPLTLAAVALGDAAPDERHQARGELARLKLDRDLAFPLYTALAGTGHDERIVRERWPAWYLATATGALYARTRWDDGAVWFVAECQRGLDVDHRQPKAGTFVLSRGKDDLIVDPSPYGSLSTLTSNAPTVASRHFPRDYIPSQSSWGTAMRWAWITRTSSGVLAARCDYADAYRFQHRASDVPEALRDFVLVPGNGDRDAALIVVDRARTGAAGSALHLQFHVRGELALVGDAASKTVGGSRLAIASALRSGGAPALVEPTAKDCFAAGVVRGRCDAARFPATAVHVELPGPAPRAVHVFAATDLRAPPLATTPLQGEGWSGVHVSGPRATTIVWPTGAGMLRYRGAPGTHVVLDATTPGAGLAITGRRDDEACAISVAPGGPIPAYPAVFAVDASCTVRVDPANAAPILAAAPAPVRRAGCCDARSTPGSSLLLALVLLGLGARPARRRSLAPRRRCDTRA